MKNRCLLSLLSQERLAKSKDAKVAKFGAKTGSPILLQEQGAEISFRSIERRLLPGE